jgi:hypothetical protein
LVSAENFRWKKIYVRRIACPALSLTIETPDPKTNIMRKIARKTLDLERLQCRSNKTFLGPWKAKCQQLGPERLPNCPSIDHAVSGEAAGQLVLI